MPAEPLGTETVLAAHRRRFVAPLLASDGWIDADADREGAGQAAVVLALAARPVAARVAALDTLLERVAAGGVLAVAADGDPGVLSDALRSRFARVVIWRQRPLAGSILVREAFAAARVAALADGEAAGAEGCALLIGSDTTLPIFAEGIYEGAVSHPAGEASAPPVVSTGASAETEDRAALRMRAAALVDRLAAVDAERLVAFRAQRAVQAGKFAAPAEPTPPPAPPQPDAPAPDLARPPPPVAAEAPAPPPPESPSPPARPYWPLLDGTRTEDPYDRRVEDEFVAVARAGAAFIERYRLDGPDADFAGAVAAIHALRPGSVENPQASIVIPVHGQLGYTLNCLHSLAILADRTRAEIIVVDDASPDATAAHLAALPWVRLLRREANGGFIAACNAGAAMARAELIVLLNNDTRVLPHWLDCLADSFRTFPRAGIVGSKLLYPDGTLQEAGGIVWRDGDAWNYGRNDDPNQPRYCFSRQVDYASGASLAIPKVVWDQLGGLDAHFAPAYYEEGDLYFRARAAGYQTWLQSGSRLIHYEGKTAGTDLGSGVKAFQRVNARKFRVRHRDTLLDHQPMGVTPVLARDRVRRRCALLVEATVPTPKEDAGSLYTLAVLRILVDLDYSVTFVPQDNFLYRPGYTEALMHMGVECIHAPYDIDFDRFMAREGARFDLAIVFRARVFAQIHASLRRFAPQAPLVLNDCDLEYLRLQRAAALSGDAADAAEAEAAKARELAAMAQADCILSPSSYEVELIGRELPGASVFALPLMVERVGTSVGPKPRRDVCFLGGYAHAPNVDAVGYFARTVWPTLRERAPGTRFVIAGANPTAEVRALAGPDIDVTGFIDDLAPMFDAMRVFVCPLRYGAGMKGKILAAMAHGVPVVTTPVGIEGIDAVDGADVLVADTPEAIAASCLRLLRDDALWRRLSTRGLALIDALYSRERGQQTLGHAIERAFDRWAEAAPSGPR